MTNHCKELLPKKKNSYRIVNMVTFIGGKLHYRQAVKQEKKQLNLLDKFLFTVSPSLYDSCQFPKAFLFLKLAETSTCCYCLQAHEEYQCQQFADSGSRQHIKLYVEKDTELSIPQKILYFSCQVKGLWSIPGNPHAKNED